MQLFQNIETGLTGDVHIEQDAGWRPRSCNRQQSGAVGETDDPIATRRQDHRKRVANGRVVIDYEDLPAEGAFSAMFHRPCVVECDSHSDNGIELHTGPYLYGTAA